MISSVAIVGSGALGTYYGARLTRVGRDVRMLMRSDLAAARERGVTLHEREETAVVTPVKAFGSPAEIGVVDLVLVTIKTTANDNLGRLLAPLVGPATLVLTLQNGLGNEERVAAALGGGERVLGGICFIAVVRDGPAVLRGFHTPGRIVLGEFGREAEERTREVAALLTEGGMDVRVTDRLAQARWRKLVWNVPFNGLAIAAGGLTTDRLLASPERLAEVRELMREVQAAGRAQGFDLPDAFLAEQVAVTYPMGPYKPSSLVDWLAGREVEVESIWGETLRRSRAAGVETPRLAALYARLIDLCAQAERR